jgi:hypothetical protein
MNRHYLLAALWLGLAGSPALALAQTTTLPRVTVTAPAWSSQHGGYLISGDFKVDPRMPYLVFPAQALVQDDILYIRPVHLNDDEYLVLQECAVADCSVAKLVRVWDTCGTSMAVKNSEFRIWITHENKYFLWLKRLPVVSEGGSCGGHFDQFEPFSPPVTLRPQGRLAAEYRTQLQSADETPPVPVKTQAHEGATFVVSYVGGSTVRIQRMHANH